MIAHLINIMNLKHEMFWNTKDTADFLGISKNEP